jgi:GTP cyclohydrolase I
MPAKPTEIKKIVAMLDEEAPSVEWLAEQIFDMVEEMLLAREQYVVIAKHPDLNLLQAVGPWYSKPKMMKEWSKFVGAYNQNSRAGFAQLKHMSKIK